MFGVQEGKVLYIRVVSVLVFKCVEGKLMRCDNGGDRKTGIIRSSVIRSRRYGKKKGRMLANQKRFSD